MSNVFVIIKMCYVHNQWYDISCATLHVRIFPLYIHSSFAVLGLLHLIFFLVQFKNTQERRIYIYIIEGR